MGTTSALELLQSAVIPARTDSYTPIAHATIDTNTKNILRDLGFVISKINYRSSTDGMVGQAEYHLNYGNDPDMGLMVAWQNSYNKLVSFKYAVGAHVMVCSNGCVAGDIGAYKRKHTGTADIEAFEIMRNYLYGAKQIFDKLVSDKEHLKKINLEASDMAAILGRMFIHKEIITSTQINIIKREMQNPTHDYGVPPNNAWALYNYTTFAFKEDSPRNWMKRHIDLHQFFSENFDIESSEFIPKAPPVEQGEIFSDMSFEEIITEIVESPLETATEEDWKENWESAPKVESYVDLLDDF